MIVGILMLCMVAVSVLLYGLGYITGRIDENTRPAYEPPWMEWIGRKKR